MTTASETPASSVVAVVVTYNPEDIGLLLSTLREQCEAVVVVDNGSKNSDDVRDACTQNNAHLLALPENLGIAAAQNIGIDWARERGAEAVLLMDHDSLPAPDMVERLWEQLVRDDSRAAVGPLAAEEREGADQLVYVAREWKPGRASAEELNAEAVDVAFLIASGCLIRMDALDDVGGMNEALFIDHVDLEWGLRARNAGWTLAAIPAARLRHELGDEVAVVPGRAQPIHVHSPIRNYYLARNTVWLIRESGLAPPKWRARYVWWLAKYVGFNGVGMQFMGVGEQAQGSSRRRMLAQGLRDGIRGRMGRQA